MKKLIETLSNIWKIEDLRKRILYTLGLIFLYRLGSYIVLPGVDPEQLQAIGQQGAKGIFSLLDIFAGGAFTRGSIFALGIMPYISASIVMQLLSMALPALQKLQREGESGRRKINSYTRYLTVAITAAQASGYVVYLKNGLGANVVVAPQMFWLSSVVILTAGTIFIMWMGERITDRGIGNGISLMITVGIIATLPFALFTEFESRLNEGGGLIAFLLEIAAILAAVLVVILLVQGTRKIPVQYAKRVVGNKMYGGVRQYIPLKVNAAGVMPIIFAQAIMFIPATIAQFFPDSEAMQGAVAFTNPASFWYNFVNSILIILFTYFYTAIIINPVQMADDMKRNGGFIPGVKPGKQTANFIDNVMSRITLPGALLLAFIAMMPAFAQGLGVNSQFAGFFGGTSLLITVGVMLDTLQQIESHLLMRHYDGLMKSGRIKGRATAPVG
ncbi:MAG: preprotein translocase subunit SecY [Chitinophagales bacterium]|nr:preprotein translocase subunit SecY [Chitinophagales bacterium]MDW8427543.1 preprotein translocase subunit SecY [Chitinophagales bacterium]